VYGTMTEQDTVVWTSSNQDIRNNPPLQTYSAGTGDNGEPDYTDLVWAPERQYVMSYSENTLADNGYVEYDKTVTLDTGNQAANQNNFLATKNLDFVSALDRYGRVTTEESLMLDGASQGSAAGGAMLCPFGTGDSGFIPAYCNIIEMGSSFTGSQVSMVTRAGERHIASSADVPVSMEYLVSLSGTGSASAWINAHLMEGRTGIPLADYDDGEANHDTWMLNPDLSMGAGEDIGGFMQGMDLVYKEKTTASGTIAAFSKSMSYQSGVRRI